ncbi:unnamed protein product [Rhizoctonia solani]|uniref:BTB domain-containing protein n=1 Tax=Rhizoctonia solani TaxID=456999 RepID=A0A8H3A7Q5_9AGAM|nr:unnamed protein product [Rhizoctonia solani]
MESEGEIVRHFWSPPKKKSNPDTRRSLTVARRQGSTSTPDSTNNQHPLNDAAQSVNPDTPIPSSSSSREVSTIHDFIGVNIELQVNDVNFRIHESRISKFASLHQLVDDARRVNPLSNTLAIALLSASPVEPVDLSYEVLVSAARISTIYDYPTLRAFCIKQLEGLPLGAIERLRIGRTLDLKSWEERAYQELTEREEAITKEEMLALGIDAYFEVASMRDKRQKDQITRLTSDLRAMPALRHLNLIVMPWPFTSGTSASATLQAPPNLKEVATVHDFAGTTIDLRVHDVVFKIPESCISKFASLSQQIEDERQARPGNHTLTIVVQGDSELASDFLATFELLRPFSIEEPSLIDPSTETLVSAARISTTYDYPTLREFCINKLEKLPLGPIERLRVGVTLDLEPWKERAYRELSEREEMVTEEEASVLGIDGYFRVASMREQHLRASSSYSNVDISTSTAPPARGSEWYSRFSSPSPSTTYE